MHLCHNCNRMHRLASRCSLVRGKVTAVEGFWVGAVHAAWPLMPYFQHAAAICYVVCSGAEEGGEEHVFTETTAGLDMPADMN